MKHIMKNKPDLIDSDDDEDKDEIKIPGLFQQIGDFHKNVFSSIGSLNFLEKLLNFPFLHLQHM